jgi:hypothetical protein
MAPRKPLFMADEGYHEEMAVSDSMTLGGLTMGGAIGMGGYQINNLANGTNATDAVTLQQLDAVAAGIHWLHPVQVLNMISDASQSGTPPVGPAIGDAYVVNTWGVGYTDGDIVEWDGTQWNVVLANSGGEPPNTTWVLVSATSATTPAGSFAGHDTDMAVYNATTNLWTFTDGAVGDATLVNNLISIYANEGYTFTGSTWIQFTGIPDVTAGDGLGNTGNILFVKAGDGIKIDNDYVAVDLSTSDPGLELIGTTPDKTLQAKVDGTHGIIRGASGLEIEIDDTPDTLDVDADGLKVVGLPSLFKINDTAVGVTVTAGNLNTLTNSGDASALHTHSGMGAVRFSPPAAEALLKADPVYWSSTNDRVGKARADNDAKSRVIGVAETAQPSTGNPVPVVGQGMILGAVSLAIAGTPYYLQATGGLGTAVPGANKRVILCGYATNATDFWVHILDFGKKSA